MAGKGAVALDKVVINIESGVGNTHKNIDKLAKSLEGLKKSISGGFNNVKRLADGLKELNKASKNLPNTVKNLKGLSKITEGLKSLSSLEKPSGLTSTVNALEKLPKVFKEINPKSLENVKRVSSELATALTPLSEKLQKIGNGFTALSTLAKTYGVKITRVGDQTNDMAKKLTSAQSKIKLMGKFLGAVGSTGGTVLKGLNKAFDKMGSKIKQVGLSLLGTRTIFTLTRKAVSEYMQMDQELTKATQNVWRAMGAQLAPAIEYVIHLFKQAVRVIYSIVYALTGIDLIARANAKALSAMGKSAGDALGNLQKFDDLNVATFDKGSGDDNQIKLDKIDLTPIQEVINWMKKLKDTILQAWNNGGWNEVAVVLAEGINGVANYIDPVAIARKIGNGVIGALDFIKTFIENSNWETLGAKIGDVFRNIPWRDIWDKVVETAKAAFGGFDGFMDELFNFEGAGELAIGIWGGSKIADIFGGGNIVKMFGDLITNAGTLRDKLGEIPLKLESIKKAYELVDQNMLTTKSISGITGVPDILTKLMVPLTKIMPTLTTVFTKVGALLGGGVGTGAVAVIGAVVVAVMALVKAFKNLWENSEPFRETINGLIASMQGTFLTVMEAVKGILIQLWDVLKVLWEQVLVPIFNLLVSIFEAVLPPVMTILSVLWKNVLAPIIEGLVNLLRPILGVIIDVIKSLVTIIGVVVDAIQWLWDYLLAPFIKFILDIVVGTIEVLGLAAEVVIDWIVAAFQWLVDTFALGWAVIKSGFSAAYKFVKEKFVDPLLKAWESIVNGLTKAWENIKNGFKNGINGVIGFLNKMINSVNSKLAINVSDSIAAVLKAIGVNISSGKYQIFTIPTIPKLETGTNEVPYEGLYHLHPGEAVVPKKYNPALGSGTDEEVGQKLDTLISIMNNMNFTNVVNIGNETLYKKQQRYNKMQNDKYGTTVNL